MPDSRIDFSDAREGKPSGTEIQIGRFYRPIKQLVNRSYGAKCRFKPVAADPTE